MTTVLRNVHRTPAARLPEGVPDHSGHVHDHVGRTDTAGLHVHVHTGRQSAFGQQTGANDIADEQHQKDILVRVLRAVGTTATVRPPSSLEEDAAAGPPHYRRAAIFVVHRVLVPCTRRASFRRI